MHIQDKPERTGNPYRFLYLLPAILAVAVILRVFVFVSPEVKVRRVLDRARKAANEMNVDAGMELTSEDFTVRMAGSVLPRHVFKVVAAGAVGDLEFLRVNFETVQLSISADGETASARIDAGITGKSRVFGLFQYKPGDFPLAVRLEKRDRTWKIVHLDLGGVHF